MSNKLVYLVCILMLPALARPIYAADPNTFVNSLGMKMVKIPAGIVSMGSEDGDFDEKPVHNVTLSQAFYIGSYEVTNAQYEQFDPNHGRLDHRGFSHEPNEAVIFVSWHDANAFCQWLSQKEHEYYRLPTEAEWEYACRAGTTTEYNTGDTCECDKNQSETSGPEPVPLNIGNGSPNAWGLCDMHGNVEEWCYDWYGPYEPNDQTDPVGYIDGDFRVARGGSHSTPHYFLRSANRMGTLPEDKHWLLGFRVVIADLPTTEPLPKLPPQLYQTNVSQLVPPDIEQGPDPNLPYFDGPRYYVKIPPGSNGPLFSNHNHDPALTECPNGDLLAIWYTTIREKGRELAVGISRLRYGRKEWEQASPFWNAPDRNDHCPAMWTDETGKIYQFAGLADAATWGALAVITRTSTDNGVTWSRARLIIPEHAKRHMPVESVFRTSAGSILLPCDANPGTAVWLSDDNGITWYDPGGTIAGIHAGVVELTDTRLMAFGRGDNIDGRMPKSISDDMGQNWTYSASKFPTISGGQRLVLRRLQEGPILFISFTGSGGMAIIDANGIERTVYGMFAALSFDEGRSWPIKKLVTAGGPPQQLNGGGNTGPFTMDDTHAEPRGYLAATQSPNGIIHLISSALHYQFNFEWLAQRASVVDDFELYTDTADLLTVWADNQLNQTNMTIHLDETSHRGSKSMRCRYDNRSHPFYGQADLIYDPPRDWLSGGAGALELWFRGDEGNDTHGRMYVTVEDADSNSAAVDYNDINHLANEQWHRWDISLQDFAGQGVDLTAVKKFSIALTVGGSGTVYFDDIRLYPPRCLHQLDSPADLNDDCKVDFADFCLIAHDWLKSDSAFDGVSPDPNGLLLWYKFDESEDHIVTDSSGNEHHGTIIGATNWDENGYHEGCLSFNDDTVIEVPTDVLCDVNDQLTVTVWLNAGEGTIGRDNTVFETGADEVFLRADVPLDSGMVYFRAGNDSSDTLFWQDAEPADWLDSWNHYAFVKDANQGIMRIYHNGFLAAEKTDAFGALAGLCDTTFDIGAIIRHQNDYIGKMDDFKIYDYALSQAEIAGAATGGGPLFVPLRSNANLCDDDRIDFKDLAVLADDWLKTGIWP